MALQNLFGDIGLDATLQKISQYLEQIASTLGRTYPDSGGNMRTVISSGTVTTVSSITNSVSVGSFSASYDQYGQMMIGAEAIRSKITVAP